MKRLKYEIVMDRMKPAAILTWAVDKTKTATIATVGEEDFSFEMPATEFEDETRTFDTVTEMMAFLHQHQEGAARG